MDSIEERLFQLVQASVDDLMRGAHALDHTKRVLAICVELGTELGANLRVLRAAAILHDIGRSREAETGISHAILSGEMSRDVLAQQEYSQDEIQHVVDVIRTHRFSEGLEPTSIEGKILSDADNLDAIGAVGVYRSIAYTTHEGQGLQEFLEHADEKLLKLRDLMYTEPAKRLAAERHEFLESFVERLRQELRPDSTIFH